MKVLDQGQEDAWHAWWVDARQFLCEIDAAIEVMRLYEQKPMEAYLDPEKIKKVHMTPKPLSKGYTKLCKFYKQGRCRNGGECTFEHRFPGEGWPENGPTESVGSNADDNGEDIGKPPTEE